MEANLSPSKKRKQLVLDLVATLIVLLLALLVVLPIWWIFRSSLMSTAKLNETMKGIYTTSINENTLDEAPMAYKSLEDIIDVIRESVDVIDVMKPIYNFKASD